MLRPFYNSDHIADDEHILCPEHLDVSDALDMEAATQNALLLLSLTVRVVKLNHASLICLAATMAERQRLKMGMAGWPARVAAAFAH